MKYVFLFESSVRIRYLKLRILFKTGKDLIDLGGGDLNNNSERKVPPSLPNSLPVGDSHLGVNNTISNINIPPPPPSYYPKMDVRFLTR